MACIRRIKTSGPTDDDVALLKREAEALAHRGAERVIIGCSEFSLVSARVSAPVPVLDTPDVLVGATRAFSGARAKSDRPPLS